MHIGQFKEFEAGGGFFASATTYAADIESNYIKSTTCGSNTSGSWTAALPKSYLDSLLSTAAKRKEYTATGTAKDASGLWHVNATDIVAAKTDADKQFKFLQPIIDHYVDDCYVKITGSESL
jgi:hypothetical protein